MEEMQLDFIQISDTRSQSASARKSLAYALTALLFGLWGAGVHIAFLDPSHPINL